MCVGLSSSEKACEICDAPDGRYGHDGQVGILIRRILKWAGQGSEVLAYEVTFYQNAGAAAICRLPVLRDAVPLY